MLIYGTYIHIYIYHTHTFQRNKFYLDFVKHKHTVEAQKSAKLGTTFISGFGGLSRVHSNKIHNSEYLLLYYQKF